VCYGVLWPVVVCCGASVAELKGIDSLHKCC